MANINKFQIDIPLVHRLIAAQFPQWAGLPIKPIKPEGWDNKTFRLGDQMTIHNIYYPMNCYKKARSLL
ncbi:hypothetical protein I862_07630 [endosymbiont of Acanthamoeba sp. UWC8]|uniref:hypothetical protein n=1 Tax=endosymbiont of Acanthamoeba sp. UWC8 TaxID=86106 RepID=UPI0004D1568E|nr:hypothetical protein [endosymbiont of Acanthamoeba sp. UWC8]AIF82080.1 hypothetical protein I862_07630 [endosymbiont of Acanthamoeba sp. UWC8]